MLVVQHLNADISVPLDNSVMSKRLEYVLVLDIELKESFVFPMC